MLATNQVVLKLKLFRSFESNTTLPILLFNTSELKTELKNSNCIGIKLLTDISRLKLVFAPDASRKGVNRVCDRINISCYAGFTRCIHPCSVPISQYGIGHSN